MLMKEVILLDFYKDLIRKRIKEKFSTIENFSKHTNIPRTTINFILKNGVSLSNYGMVNTILKELDIHPVNEHPVVIDEKLLDFIKIYSSLDDIGRHAVTAVAETEYRRLHPEFLEEAIIAAYGSITSGKPLTEEEKAIMDIVDKIKKDNNDK
jgi:predicted transcriptional regulator